MTTACVLLICCVLPGAVPLEAGTARASITPLEADIPTQLGGYGAREGGGGDQRDGGGHGQCAAGETVSRLQGRAHEILSLFNHP